jgi:hypothetical protein
MAMKSEIVDLILIASRLSAAWEKVLKTTHNIMKNIDHTVK